MATSTNTPIWRPIATDSCAGCHQTMSAKYSKLASNVTSKPEPTGISTALTVTTRM